VSQSLNTLLSFAQFKREVIGERIRDDTLLKALARAHRHRHPVLKPTIKNHKKSQSVCAAMKIWRRKTSA
jgi:DNA invertase Pin-like site-specific DNA recombinase